jgi:hypothetical protein
MPGGRFYYARLISCTPVLNLSRYFLCVYAEPGRVSNCIVSFRLYILRLYIFSIRLSKMQVFFTDTVIYRRPETKLLSNRSIFSILKFR